MNVCELNTPLYRLLRKTFGQYCKIKAVSERKQRSEYKKKSKLNPER